jgi:chromosome segregation protein
MRISKIKLAGFKSFVDPTVLLLPGNLTGVVGPNGCGKSNIIDALLWVMGESSAKHLRGDSMSDVIFNGSSSRKPIGQAAVEIVFDNKDQGLGGQYASYGEIAIKRQVSRDGVSVYYLNGARCRRRDITDLFLGKGIGSRSYSVIEQGMISRVIEAKPEELRLFLEEAAGISKYKERRQETENRLRHTKDNITRLNDIRNELDARLSHLDQQAQAAEKYQRLKASQRKAQAELLVLNWRALQQEFENKDRNIRQLETAREGVLAHLREIELSIEKTRVAQSESTEQFNQVQARYYTLGAEISRLEQGIQHARERRATLDRDLKQASLDLAAAESEAAQNEHAWVELTTAIEKTTPEHERLMAAEQDVSDRLEKSEEATQRWQGEWDQFNQQTSEVLREEKGETTRIAHLEADLAVLRQRIEALRREKDGLAPEDLEQSIQDFHRRIGEAETAFQGLQSLRAEKQERIEEVREEVESITRIIDQDRHAQQVMSGRLASLKTLQQSTQPSDRDTIHEWLESHGLADTPSLSQAITVEAGWETAVENVLDFFLHAHHVPCIETLAQDLSALQQGPLAIFDSPAGPSSSSRQAGLVGLDEKITSPWPVNGLLNGVYCVENLEEGLSLRSRLQAHESVVTQDGNRLGSHWLCIKRNQDDHAGILIREREIKELEHDAHELQARIAEHTGRLDKAREKLKYLEGERAEAETGLMAAQGSLGALRSQLAARETELDQLRSRKHQLEMEIQELESQEIRNTTSLESVQNRLASIQREVGSVEERRSELLKERDVSREVLQSARENWRLARDQRHELALKLESMRTRHISLEQALNRSRSLAGQIAARVNEHTLTLNHLEDPTERRKTELDQALAERLAVEEQLRSVRAGSQALDARLRTEEQARAGRERELQSMRDALAEARLEGQTTRVHLDHFEEQVQTLGFQRQALIEELPPDAEKEVWERNLESFERRIQRLGPINLAAIDEFAQLSERKNYLDRQHDDLAQAMETLENAIRKIDRETRDRFKETFDKVNASLQNLFPILFGGGHAHLELTGEDLLETGVRVIAHPPGKRNSTIHLLSGGEKALTALSLVFAIFELNPAPFCLLDEVDAPLDDANVIRLCDMLKARSEKVQFLFVTHNKTTMEIAENLIGVTMQEAGVSRLVAVDVDEAMAMVATG